VSVLTLSSGMNQLTSAVIDTTNGYAYFGTGTSPGIVAKVSLGSSTASPSLIGSVTLSSGMDGLYSAVIDTTNGSAYFGTGTVPGIVVKVSLGSGTASPSLVGYVTLSSGMDILYSAVIDTTNGSAYFGTGTSPGIMAKINVTTWGYLSPEYFPREKSINFDPITIVVLGVALAIVVVLYTRNRWQQRKQSSAAKQVMLTSPLISEDDDSDETNPMSVLMKRLRENEKEMVISFRQLQLEPHHFAAGGGGRVYKGKFGSVTIAAKEIYSSIDGDMAEFEKESTLLYNLRHPYVVVFYGISYNDDSLYIISEFCPGTLCSVVELKNTSARDYSVPKDALRYALQVCEGISFLHSRGVAHRDIKPQNILLDGHDNCKICDLGLAALCSRASTEQTKMVSMTTGVGGTPVYQPPESTLSESSDSDKKHYDPRKWDIFSLSMLFWYLWERQHPFHEVSNIYKIILKVAYEKLRPPLPLPPKMPKSLSQLIAHMWEHEPGDRPHIDAVLEILRQIQAEINSGGDGEDDATIVTEEWHN